MSDEPLTRETLMRDIDSTWNEFVTYLESLSEDQLTRPTDAAGWTAKDHVIHVAMWETAWIALLEGKSKREAMDIPEDVSEEDDDPINAVFQQRHRDMLPADVMLMLHDNHTRVRQKLRSMTEADLELPYRHYNVTSAYERPLLMWLLAETVHHYRDHLTWIKAIVENG